MKQEVILTHRDIMNAPALLMQLGNFSFGRKVRYAIRYNLNKLERPSKLVREERQAIFEKCGGIVNEKEQRYEFPSGDAEAEALKEAGEFLDEEDRIRLEVVTDEDTGDVAFPPNLMPLWMCPLPEEDEEEETPVLEGMDETIEV